MTKFLLPVLFLLITYFVTPFLPWYFIGILALIAALVNSGGLLKTYAIYFAAGFGLWYSLAMMNDLKSGAILSSKIGILFGNIPKQAILFATGLMGGVTAGLGGMVGNSIHSILAKPASLKQTTGK